MRLDVIKSRIFLIYKMKVFMYSMLQKKSQEETNEENYIWREGDRFGGIRRASSGHGAGVYADRKYQPVSQRVGRDMVRVKESGFSGQIFSEIYQRAV